MSEFEPIPKRWRDAQSQSDEPAARLFQRVVVPELQAADLERVRLRIASSLSNGGAGKGGSQPLPRSSLLRGLMVVLGAVAVVLLGWRLRPGGGGARQTAVAPTARSSSVSEPRPLPPPAAVEPAGERLPAQRSDAPPADAVVEPATARLRKPILRAAPARVAKISGSAKAPLADPQPAETASVAPATASPAPVEPSTPPSRTTELAPAPRQGPGADESSLAEFQLVSSAVRELRRQHDATATLRILDGYDHRFPRGELQPEARWLRVQALIQLGRRREALTVLDAESLSADHERSSEPLVLRGQLRSEAGRCREALPDFDAAASRTTGELLERTLLGRGGCRARTGDPVGARADYAAYQERFPTGRYADAVRSALRELETK